MAAFILLIVSLIICQTWLDWRDAERQSAFPNWASGLALAGVLGAFLTTTTSVASLFYQDSVGGWANGFGSFVLWPQLGLLLCALSIVVLAVRQKRMRLLLLLAGVLTAAFYLGFALST